MDKRRPLIAGNWKMFKSCTEAAETAEALVKNLEGVTDRDVIIAPSFTALYPVSMVVKGSCISLCAQNLFWETEGAYTGEVSAAMLVSAGCRYVIVGHSERRQYFHETDEAANRRMLAALGHQLIPVFCVGESEQERDADRTFSVIDKQVRIGIKGITLKNPMQLVIAYEPVWAIGTGKTATSRQAQEVHAFIRSLLKEIFGDDLANSIRILYGGSVKPDNIDELMALADVDGVLVGGASLNADSFSAIVHY